MNVISIQMDICHCYFCNGTGITSMNIGPQSVRNGNQLATLYVFSFSNNHLAGTSNMLF